jgi:hypothetical protein
MLGVLLPHVTTKGGKYPWNKSIQSILGGLSEPRPTRFEVYEAVECFFFFWGGRGGS